MASIRLSAPARNGRISWKGAVVAPLLALVLWPARHSRATPTRLPSRTRRSRCRDW
jgi:hypothetical protein